MSRPLLLDMFCCAGGAGMGYHQAGFDVIGVDFKPQPRYPFAFIQADCLTLPLWFLQLFDAITASPPCQKHTSLNRMPNAKEHLDLIPETRAMLTLSGLPWIIENVVGAPLISPIRLCGSMFGLGSGDAELQRHRDFEANFPIHKPGPCRHGSRGATIGLYGGHARNRKRAVIGVFGHCQDHGRRTRNRGRPDFTLDDSKAAMGIDWMTQTELSQAIPPAYTRWLGAQLLEQVR